MNQSFLFYNKINYFNHPNKLAIGVLADILPTIILEADRLKDFRVSIRNTIAGEPDTFLILYNRNAINLMPPVDWPL
jgi:hypothetical protein